MESILNNMTPRPRYISMEMGYTKDSLSDVISIVFADSKSADAFAERMGTVLDATVFSASRDRKLETMTNLRVCL